MRATTIVILLAAGCSSPKPAPPTKSPPAEAAPAETAAASAKAANAECGWLPERKPPGPKAVFYSYRLGCGVARSGAEAWKSVVEMNPVSLELLPDKTVVRAVFIDATEKRVLPTGHTVTWDMQFAEHKKGAITLTEAMQRDGVYSFELPASDRGPPCKTHLFMKFHNGTKELELWIDDWEYRC